MRRLRPRTLGPRLMLCTVVRAPQRPPLNSMSQEERTCSFWGLLPVKMECQLTSCGSISPSIFPTSISRDSNETLSANSGRPEATGSDSRQVSDG